MNRHRRGVLFVGLALVLAAPVVAAKTAYDGRWSVLVVTEKGDCDRAYRYEIDVADGILRLAETVAVDLRGRVAGNGAVTVSLQRGKQRADGKGKLSRTSGSGIWQGSAPSGVCSGVWTAERRK
jgi:hypothetical protein